MSLVSRFAKEGVCKAVVDTVATPLEPFFKYRRSENHPAHVKAIEESRTANNDEFLRLRAEYRKTGNNCIFGKMQESRYSCEKVFLRLVEEYEKTGDSDVLRKAQALDAATSWRLKVLERSQEQRKIDEKLLAWRENPRKHVEFIRSYRAALEKVDMQIMRTTEANM